MESKKYLTEKSLVDFCYKFIDMNGVSNRKFMDYKFRPDYVSHEKKVVVEFDGYLHFTKSATIVSDRLKDEIYKSHGYNVIRIPYFIQLDERVMKCFENYIDVSPFKYNDYPHGFIDSKAILPADFCNLGVERYLDIMEDLRNTGIDDEIIDSLDKHILSGKHHLTVYPFINEKGEDFSSPS